MSRIKGRDTSPELAVRSTLHRAGFRFSLNKKGLPGRPDIILNRYKTAVLVHGCFWHRHPGCRNATTPTNNAVFWKAKFDANVKRDTANIAALETLGWHVIVIWECETGAGPSMKALLTYLRRRKGSLLRGR